jgi:sulfur carrier protein ThiS
MLDEGSQVRVHLGGHLSWYDPARRSWLELQLATTLTNALDGPSGCLTPAHLARSLGLPPGEIALVAVNGHIVERDAATLAPGDTVEFYPPIGGG